MRRIVVIGAGLGGLAAAARLAHAGFDVRVVEKEAGPGGRCGTLADGDFRWDIGPTILLFPQVLRQLFTDCGASLDSYLDLSVCDPNYRIHYRDGSQLTMSANLRHMQAELERFAPGSFEGFLAFLELGRVAKETAFGTFLSRTFDRKREMFTPKALWGVLRSQSHRSLYSVVSELVSDERVRQALTFQTMYLGLSPYEGPALFGLLPYTEIADGVWHARGGLGAISVALAKLAEARGARITYGRAVARIERDALGVRGVTLEDGERIEADVVLANADLPYVTRALLGRPAKRAKYTSSALMFFWACDRPFLPTQEGGLHHHNVFFGGAYRQSFRRIFDEGKLPDDPSFYVANPAVSDRTMAPDGASALYVLVPAPHLREGGREWKSPALVDRVRAGVLERLERTVAPGLGASITREHVMTPEDWQARFSLEKGSAFGLAHTLFQVGAFRPPNKDRELSNLYYVGASTQPATGIPNVLIGAAHVAARIAKEQAS